jgi:soluble P-type ATPase
MVVQLSKTRVVTSTKRFDHSRIIEDIRKAEEELVVAQNQFQDALGVDHVDYAIYCLEAAERRLDMLLRKAKWQWGESSRLENRRELV